MLKKHTFWIKAAITFQLLTAFFHSLSFLYTPKLANETEMQLDDLMRNYRPDVGAGFTPSTQDLFNSMSACFPLLCLLGAFISWFLLRKKVDVSILKGIITIQFIIFGICFGVMAFLTFLPPIICTGLIFLSLVLALVTFPKPADYMDIE